MNSSTESVKSFIEDPGAGSHQPGAWSDWLESNVTEFTDNVERWLPIVTYEGYYEVSDLGGVRSVDRTVRRIDGVVQTIKGALLSPMTDNDGRRVISLYKNNKRTARKVHQLVLEAFVGPRPDGMEGCHNNGNPSDNRVENLRWDTPSNNSLDKQLHGTDYYRNKTHCKWGHQLALPNLVLKKWVEDAVRICLACSRARAITYRARKQGESVDLKSIADRYYVEIMSCKKLVIPEGSRGKEYRKRVYTRIPVLDRISQKIERDSDSGCWRWTAHLSKTGFASISDPDRGKPSLVHRWLWVDINGPIPTDASLVRDCSTRGCVNPDHFKLRLRQFPEPRKTSVRHRPPQSQFDITGQRFGRLVAVRKLYTGSNGMRWLFRCDCGNEHEAAGYHVRRGRIQSCGCYASERSKARMTAYHRHKPRAA